jgi:hypothetical protein
MAVNNPALVAVGNPALVAVGNPRASPPSSLVSISEGVIAIVVGVEAVGFSRIVLACKRHRCLLGHR